LGGGGGAIGLDRSIFKPEKQTFFRRGDTPKEEGGTLPEKGVLDSLLLVRGRILQGRSGPLSEKNPDLLPRGELSKLAEDS